MTSFNFRVNVFNWNHFCCSFDYQNNSAVVFINGEENILSLNDLPQPFVPFSSSHIDTTVLGADVEHVNNFWGNLTDFNVWRGVKENKLLKDWTKCLRGDKGDFFNWDQALISSPRMIISEEPPQQKCSFFKPGRILIPEVLKFQELSKICFQLGGQVYKVVDNNETKELILQYEKIVKPLNINIILGFWAGYSLPGQHHGVHTDSLYWSKADIIEGLKWEEGEPNGNSLEQCTSARTKTSMIYDMSCNIPHYGFCMLETITQFYLRGLETAIVDMHYFWINVLVNNKYTFKGLQTNVIEFTLDEGWIIKNSTNNPILTLGKTQYPFGKKKWVNPSTNERLWLSFDACQKEQFNCDDGTCIRIQKRCNGLLDCEDGSDEANCSQVIVPLFYNKDLPPQIEERGSSNPLFLEVKYFEFRIFEISDKSSEIEVQFGFFLTWKDPRLKFSNLELNKNNSLAAYDIEKIWLPEYSAYTIKDPLFEDITARQVDLLPLGGYRSSGTANVDLLDLFDGDQVVILYRQWFTATILCSFPNLWYFPFDINSCNLTMVIIGTNVWQIVATQDKVNFNMSLNDIKLTPETIGLYKIDKIILDTPIDKGMEITIITRRQFFSVFLQYSLPNLLLSLVVYSSGLYYKDMFDIALTVNVTCLLAMSSFFSNLFQSLPSTSSVKIMDMMHIKNILLSTIILFLQTFAVKVCKVRKIDDRCLEFFVMYFIPLAGTGLDLLFIVCGVLYEYELFSLGGI